MVGYFITLACASLVNAQSPKLPSTEIWSFGNEYYPIEKEPKTKKLISVNCNNTKCFAYKALNEHSKKQLSEHELKGGKNPGAVICTKYFKGTILILRDVKQNENAFCKFSDGSLLSASGLM